MFENAIVIVGTAAAVVVVLAALWVAIACLLGILNAIAEYPVFFAILAAMAVLMVIGYTKADAQEACTWRCILPPVEYDHPYTGKLTIEIVPNQDELAKFCGNAYIPGRTLGCARRGSGNCHIVLVPDEIIIMKGWTKELMLRHEIGHCNGWPGDHPGQRSVDQAARDKPLFPR